MAYLVERQIKYRYNAFCVTRDLYIYTLFAPSHSASRFNLNFGIDVRNVSSVTDYLFLGLVRVADLNLTLCFLVIRIYEI